MPIKLYAIAVSTLFSLDMIWIGVIAKTFYRHQIGYLMAPHPQWTAAILIYLLLAFGLVLFVIAPALKNNSSSDALLYGALFGFIAYATYDLTNLATIRNWPLLVTVVDMAWGTILAASVSSITFSIAKKIGL